MKYTATVLSELTITEFRKFRKAFTILFRTGMDSSIAIDILLDSIFNNRAKAEERKAERFAEEIRREAFANRVK